MRAASALAERYDVHVLCYLRRQEADCLRRDDAALPFRIHYLRLPRLARLPGKAGRLTRFAAVTAWMVRRAQSLRPWAVHAHGVNTLCAAHAVRAAGARLIYDANELYREYRRGAATNLLVPRLEDLVMRRSAAIIACNDERADVMHRRYRTPRRPVVVRNVPLRARAPQPSGELHNWMRQRNPRLRRMVLHPGRQSLMGLRIMLRAMAELDDDVALVLLGHDQPPADATEAIAAAGLADRVLLHPRVAYERMGEYTASADVGLALYVNTTLNNYLCASSKLGEFAAAGVPVVAMDYPPVRALADRYDYLELYRWDDPIDMAAAVRRVLADPARAESMRRAARAAADELNWDRERHCLLALYRRLEGK